MLGKRFLTAVIVLPPLTILIAWGPKWSIVLLFMAIGLLVWLEYTRLIGPLHPFTILTGFASGEIAITGLALNWLALAWAASFGGLGLLAVGALVFYSSRNEVLKEVGWTWLGLGLFLIPLGFMAGLANWPDAGRWWLLYLAAVVFSTDTGAYFVGRFLGRKKLSPHISPGKTRAGFWGGLICGSIVGLIMLIRSGGVVDLGLGFLISVLISLLAIVGDLIGSLLKRTFEVKDYSSILPGHGGLLDRLDSFILAGPSLYFLLLVLGG
jgi:phosphatidate cytidylyltransferase